MKVFRSVINNKPVIEEINQLILERGSAMVLVVNGVVFFLVDHHRYLNPEREAKRINLGKIILTEDGAYYFYQPMALLYAEKRELKSDRKAVIIRKKK